MKFEAPKLNEQSEQIAEVAELEPMHVIEPEKLKDLTDEQIDKLVKKEEYQLARIEEKNASGKYFDSSFSSYLENVKSNLEKLRTEKVRRTAPSGEIEKLGKGAFEQSGNEKHSEKVDEIFDELLDKAKDSPEAEKAAIEILVSQMRQISEQIKQTRDIRHLHELKKMMLKHWRELNDLAEGKPELIKAVTEWGKKFVEQKVIFYDMINEVKDEIIEKSQEIQSSWNDMQVDIGKISGWLGSRGIGTVEKYLEPRERVKLDFDKERLGHTKAATLDDFIETLRQVTKGFDEEDIGVAKAVEFLERVNGLIRELTKLCFEESLSQGSVISRHPEAESVLRGLSEQSKTLSKNIADTSKIYKTTKKIRDTHFLDLYAEGVAA